MFYCHRGHIACSQMKQIRLYLLHMSRFYRKKWLRLTFFRTVCSDFTICWNSIWLSLWYHYNHISLYRHIYMKYWFCIQKKKSKRSDLTVQTDFFLNQISKVCTSLILVFCCLTNKIAIKYNFYCLSLKVDQIVLQEKLTTFTGFISLNNTSI